MHMRKFTARRHVARRIGSNRRPHRWSASPIKSAAAPIGFNAAYTTI
jgi:hypothetical protein